MVDTASNAHILVTGATGFTGGHLARRLAAAGHRVRALVRSPERAADLARLGIEPVPGDLRDRAALDRATAGIETVYHIAATFRQEGIDEREFRDINAGGTRALLEAAVANEVGRFVHCSTVGVHGHIADPPADETAPYAPGDLYQESKLEGERIAQAFQQEGRIGVTIFRPGGIYGPGDLRFLKLFRAIKKRRFLMIGQGRIFYHMTYIDDLVDGIVRCGTVDRAVGQIYILSGEGYVTLNELVATIARELGAPPPRLRIPLWPVYAAGFACETVCKPLGLEPPLYRRRVDFFKKSRAFDISKAKRDLGFAPQVDLPEGVRRTAAWYAEHGHL